MPQAIETRGLRKVYRTAQGERLIALRGLEMVVQQGEIFGFIGPNGAGKTTTIKILVGLITPTSGEAFIMGRPAGSPEANALVGYMSEVAYYYSFMEAGALLDFYGSLYGMSRSQRRRRIGEVMDAVDLSDRIRIRLGEYSKGMQQRFGIAQALISSPKVLILDEPTSGLDPIAQKEIKDVILRLKEMGITIFFSSHQLTEVEHICDTLGIIHRGEMLKIGSLDHFLAGGKPGETKIRFRPESHILQMLQERGISFQLVGDGVYETFASQEKKGTVFDLLKDSGVEILELGPRRSSLEDAFFQLIREKEVHERT